MFVASAVSLRAGWNQSETTVRVLIPVGYPHVNPDCFYADASLRLASGAMPINSAVQAVFGGDYLWFSWHVTGWDPATGTLDAYLHFCEARLRDPK
jgi:hypothetical protein